MFRLILTGVFAVGLSMAGFGMATAAPIVPIVANDVAALPVQTSPEGGPVSPAAIEAAKKHLASLDAAAPTSGADLAMWGVDQGSHAALVADVSTRAAHGAQPLLKHIDGAAVRRFAGGIISRSATLAVSLTRSALRFLGTPYVFGGTSATGFDCSGYVQHVFAMLGFHLPRTADAQYVAGHRIEGGMHAGDLVFFQTYESGPSHVGIYLGSDRFVHASSSHGVTVSSLHDDYWSARYLGAKRIVN